MSDYDCIQNRRNMIVGAFVVIGIIVFIYMIFLFGELPVAVTKFTSYEIKAKFPSAPGVQKNTAVRYCGYDIGRVTHVYPPALEKNENGELINQVTAVIAISRDYKTIPANVEVELVRKGLSSSYIEFFTKPISDKELDTFENKFLCHGMVLQGKSSSLSEFIPQEVQDKMELLFTKVTLLLDNVNVVIGDVENQQNLKSSLANISKATEQSIETLQKIKEFSEAGKETMLAANEKMTSVSDSVTQSSEQMGEALIELQRVLYKINSGEGTVGKLIYDDRLYENLLNSSEELEASLTKMKKTFDETSKKGLKLSIF